MTRFRVTSTGLGVDLNPHVIAALTAIRDNVNELPESLTEDEYGQLKGLPPDPVSSWLRFVAAFGGKFGAGYARGNVKDNYTATGKRNAIKQSPKLQGVQLEVGDFRDYVFVDSLIYCDPPYEGTTGYKGTFDHPAFWEWCRKMSVDNLMFISEYNAPDDFVCIWEGGVKTNFASQRQGATHNAVEKLFIHKSQQ